MAGRGTICQRDLHQISSQQQLAGNQKKREDMAAHVKAELVERFYSAVIFQLLDNNIFFSKFEDGSLCLAARQWTATTT